MLDLGTRIAAPFCAGLLGEQGAEVIKVEQPGVAATSCARSARSSDDDDGPYSLFWAVEGRGRKSVTLDLRTPRGPGPVPAARGDGRRRRRELPARHARAVEHRARRPRPALVTVRISHVRPGRPVLRAARPRPGRHRLRRAAAPHRLPRPAAGAGRRHDLRLPHRRVRGAGRHGGAVRARRARRHGRGDRRRALRRRAAHPRVDARRRTTGSASCATREGNRLANSAPLDNYPTADGKYVCIVAGSDANFRRLCTAMDRPDLLDDPRFAELADRAARSDEINGIVADWTSSSTAADVEARCVAHDVPVATAYTAADIFADPHFDRTRRPGDGRRSGGRPGAPAGAVPALRRRAERRCRPARPGSASTPTRCSASSSGSTPPSSTRLRDRRRV